MSDDLEGADGGWLHDSDDSGDVGYPEDYEKYRPQTRQTIKRASGFRVSGATKDREAGKGQLSPAQGGVATSGAGSAGEGARKLPSPQSRPPRPPLSARKQRRKRGENRATKFLKHISHSDSESTSESGDGGEGHIRRGKKKIWGKSKLRKTSVSSDSNPSSDGGEKHKVRMTKKKHFGKKLPENVMVSDSSDSDSTSDSEVGGKATAPSIKVHKPRGVDTPTGSSRNEGDGSSTVATKPLSKNDPGMLREIVIESSDSHQDKNKPERDKLPSLAQGNDAEQGHHRRKSSVDEKSPAAVAVAAAFEKAEERPSRYDPSSRHVKAAPLGSDDRKKDIQKVHIKRRKLVNLSKAVLVVALLAGLVVGVIFAIRGKGGGETTNAGTDSAVKGIAVSEVINGANVVTRISLPESVESVCAEDKIGLRKGCYACRNLCQKALCCLIPHWGIGSCSSDEMCALYAKSCKKLEGVSCDNSFTDEKDTAQEKKQESQRQRQAKEKEKDKENGVTKDWGGQEVMLRGHQT